MVPKTQHFTLFYLPSLQNIPILCSDGLANHVGNNMKTSPARAEIPPDMGDVTSETLISDLAEELDADQSDFEFVIVVLEIFHYCFQVV